MSHPCPSTVLVEPVALSRDHRVRHHLPWVLAWFEAEIGLEGKRLPLRFLPWETAARRGAAPCRWVPGSGLRAHLGPPPRGRAELQLGRCRAIPGPALSPLPRRDARGSPVTHMLSPVSHCGSWAGDAVWDSSPQALPGAAAAAVVPGMLWCCPCSCRSPRGWWSGREQHSC